MLAENGLIEPDAGNNASQSFEGAGIPMDVEHFTNLATDELLDRAAALATTAAEDSDERWAAVAALRQRPERTVFERAAEWCASTNAAHRSLGADVLAQLGAPACPFAVESTPLLVALLRDPVENVVVEALYAVGHLRVGPTLEIAGFARHASERVRTATAHALGGRDEPASIDALCLLTADTDSDVRDWATFALGLLCDSDTPEIREALVARIADDNDAIRGEALVGLARRGDKRATAAIRAEFARPEVSALVIEAAELLPSREFITPLRALWDLAPDENIFRALQACEAAVDPPAP